VTKTLAIIAALAIGTAAAAQEQSATPPAPPAATEAAPPPAMPAAPPTAETATPPAPPAATATPDMAAPAATAMQAATPAPPTDYPKCSAKVHDKCVQSAGGGHATRAWAHKGHKTAKKVAVSKTTSTTKTQ